MSKNELNFAVSKIFKEFHYDRLLKYSDELIEQIEDVYKDDFKDWIGERQSNRYKYIMFTINPKEGVNVEEFLKKIKKMLTKKWIKQYLYCIEWRSECMTGMHAHIKCWICDKKNPYHCKREVYNTFKYLVGNKSHVHPRYSNRKGCFDDYINGIKDGKPKEFSEYDRNSRKLLGIPNVFKSNAAEKPNPPNITD